MGGSHVWTQGEGHREKPTRVCKVLLCTSSIMHLQVEWMCVTVTLLLFEIVICLFFMMLFTLEAILTSFRSCLGVRVKVKGMGSSAMALISWQTPLYIKQRIPAIVHSADVLPRSLIGLAHVFFNPAMLATRGSHNFLKGCSLAKGNSFT